MNWMTAVSIVYHKMILKALRLDKNIDLKKLRRPDFFSDLYKCLSEGAISRRQWIQGVF